MDYEKFEGRTIRFINYKGTEIIGHLVGVEYDIGITIVCDSDRDRYLSCLKGPSAEPDFYANDSDYLVYNELFENSLFMIKDGFFDERVIEELLSKHGEEPGVNAGPESCPFNK